MFVKTMMFEGRTTKRDQIGYVIKGPFFPKH